MRGHFFHWMVKGIQDFFVVDTRQAKGLLVMMLLMVLVVATPLVIRMTHPSSYGWQAPVPQDQLDQLILQLEQARNSQGNTNNSLLNLPQPSALDPNVANQEALEAVGFPRWMAERIIKYRQAGGVYADKEDMMRLYGMTEEMYGKAATWIRFPAQLDKEKKKPSASMNPVKSGGQDTASAASPVLKVTPESEVFILEINTSDTLQLQKIRGIGPVLASRIVRYRDLLGGFYNEQQLREVYGLSEETLSRLLEVVVVDSLRVQQSITVNKAEDPADLARHPYLSFREARAIINYRKQHGPYERWEDLKELYSLADSTLLKIKPYIKLDDENP